MDIFKISFKIASDDVISEATESYLVVDTDKDELYSVGNDPTVQDALITVADSLKAEYKDGVYRFLDNNQNSLRLDVIIRNLRDVPVHTKFGNRWFYGDELHSDVVQKRYDVSGELFEEIFNLNKADVVVHSLAKNPKCPEHILMQMAGSDDENLRESVASNEGGHYNVLTKLSSDPSEFVRLLVVENFRVPNSILEDLSNDKSTMVREEAKKKLKIRNSNK